MVNRAAWEMLRVLCRRVRKQNINGPSAILVMLNGRLGDVVQTSPVLRALKAKWPNAKIDYCVYGDAADGLTNNPNIRHIIRADSFGHWSLIKPVPILRLSMALRKNKYDWAVCLGRDATYGIVARLAGVKYIAGLIDRGYKNAFLDLSIEVPYNDRKPRVNNYKALGESIGLDFSGGLLPEVFWTKADEMLIDSALGPGKNPMIGIFPGGGPNAFRPWVKRSWPVEKWMQVMQSLSAKYTGCSFVMLGRGADGPVNRKIISALKTIHCHDLTDKTTFPQMAYALSKCRVLISTDSSPVFAATAVGCPTIVLYGPEWPERSPADRGDGLASDNHQCGLP